MAPATLCVLSEVANSIEQQMNRVIAKGLWSTIKGGAKAPGPSW